MKLISKLVVIVFVLIIILPVLAFNFEPDMISEIDNRKLAENPFSDASLNDVAVLRDRINEYVQDRIGFRDDMILAYTIANDRLFNKMVHPSYQYGKDGYVFFSGTGSIEYGEFHDAFADAISKMQRYCEERGVPFFFAFEPAKTSALQKYLPPGMNYNNDWVIKFFSALEQRGVHIIDNSKFLDEKIQEGQVIFNKQFDAGHWNDLGAFYGVNNILEDMHEQFPAITPNSKEEFKISESLMETLPVSKFPIHEMVPNFSPKYEVDNFTQNYNAEVKRDYNYRGFGFYSNEKKKAAGVPRTLVFQGSYMNGKGGKFLANALGEYIEVHNYQNVLNLPYYFQLFEPEAVVFEVTEYTVKNNYFNIEKMKNIDWNVPLENYKKELSVAAQKSFSQEETTVDTGTHFSTVHWKVDESFDHVWMIMNNQEFDMWTADGENTGYESAFPKEYYSENTLSFVTEKDNIFTVYT